MNSISVLNQIKNMEDELQMIKLAPVVSPKYQRHPFKAGIVESTSGLLGKNFPSGIVYEDSIRKNWKNRIKKLGL